MSKTRLARFEWGYPTDDFIAQQRIVFDPMSEVSQRLWCDPNCFWSPFNNFIGNRSAVERLQISAYNALNNPLHKCSELSWALFGPSSTGKTTLAKLFAQVLGLPFIEIPGTACTSTDYILEKINDVLISKYGFPLVFMGEEGFFKLPPMIIFIDEVHELPSAVEQGLLTGVERKDARLVTPKGFIADTSNVTWVIATTDSGDLFDAFVNRFTHIYLHPYTYEEISDIVKINFQDWSKEICSMVSKYSDRVPRTALAFASEMKLTKAFNKNESWEEIASKVAERNLIDEFGMSLRRVAVLKALFKYGAMAARNLGFQEGVNCKEKELIKYVLPPLLAATADQPRLVMVSSRGISITEAGLDELKKRGIGVGS